jgi:hypothetical protein
VNDVVVASNDTLVSCSSDTTLKVSCLAHRTLQAFALQWMPTEL